MDIFDTDSNELSQFLNGKSEHTLMLFHHFVNEFQKVGPVTLYSAKTMIGIANSHKRVVYITQLGKNFIDVVFPFNEIYDDNLCFIKIKTVPGTNDHNHYFRMYLNEDLNDEVKKYMKMAYEIGS